jgi:HlyD family secretion protein
MPRDNQKRKPRAGDIVWQNQPLLYLPDISSMVVKTLVREIDLHKVSTGQKATIRVDAYPKLLLSGRVTSIGVMASEGGGAESGDKHFQVIVAVDGEHPDLRPGMTSRVVLHVGSARDVLSVPVQAVFNEGADRFCFVYRGQKATKVRVETGRQNEDLVEIVAGLKPGDRVGLARPSPDEAIR